MHFTAKLNKVTSRLLASWRGGKKSWAAKARIGLERLETRAVLTTFLTNVHTDVGASFGADWNLFLIDKDNNVIYDPKDTVLEFVPKTKTTRPADPRFDFIGVDPGAPVWITPLATPRDPDLLQLGVSGEPIDSDTFASYNETDPRLPNTIPVPWVKLSVMDVRGPGHFSAWQIDSFDELTVWVATAPNANPNPNVFFTLAGGHIDYNWAFTAPGTYEVDIKASAFLPDMTPTESKIITYHFQVDDTSRPSRQGFPGQEEKTPSPSQEAALFLGSRLEQATVAEPSSLVQGQLSSKAQTSPTAPALAPARVEQLFALTKTDHASSLLRTRAVRPVDDSPGGVVSGTDLATDFAAATI